MLVPGLVSVTFRKLTPEEIVALAAECGLAAIEWGSDVHVPADRPALGAEVRRLTEAAGLRVASYGSYYRVGDSDPHPFGAYVETARELGAPAIRVWAGRKGSDQADDAHWQAIVDDSRRIADQAAAAGMVVAFEYHGHTLTDTAAAARRLMESAAHPNLRIYWQTRTGMDRAGNLAELEAVTPWLHNVHCFHHGGTPPRQLSLAEGEADWAAYLARITSLGGDRNVMLEFVKDGAEDALRADAVVLKRLLG